MRNGMFSLKAIYMTWFTEYLSFPSKNFSEHILDHNYTSATNTVLFSDWSCRSVYRRQDVCVAKVILWILSSCTYWWENRYPYPPLLHDGTTPIVGWWPPYPYLVDDPPTHTWLMTPHPYLADDPPPHSWLMTPLPILAWWPPMVGWSAESS